LVLLTPVLFFVIFAVVQLAFVYHGRHVALAAAQQAARTARSAGLDQGQAVRRARADALSYLSTVGGDIIDDPRVRVHRGPDTATVVVRGKAVTVVPGLALHVAGKAGGPVEKFHPHLRAATTSAPGSSGGQALGRSR
jgi:Flp pilus assembly protein TadG